MDCICHMLQPSFSVGKINLNSYNVLEKMTRVAVGDSVKKSVALLIPCFPKASLRFLEEKKNLSKKHVE